MGMRPHRSKRNARTQGPAFPEAFLGVCLGDRQGKCRVRGMTRNEMMREKPLDALETARLTAERIRSSHYPELCRMHRDSQVMETLGGLRTDEQTRLDLQRNLVQWERHDFGLWIFRDKADGRF